MKYLLKKLKLINLKFNINYKLKQMFKNIIFKKDHYEVEHLLEYKNCEILEYDSDWVYIKLSSFNKIVELKNTIVKLLNKNPELYCDCKKIIYNSSLNGINNFEEVIKVEKNKVEINNGINLDLSILIYGIWISNSSYGPMLKLINTSEIQSSIKFLPDPEECNSDEEIDNSLKYYQSLKELKKTKVKKVRETKKVKEQKELETQDGQV